jgi:serine/threonine protein kinase
MTCLVALLVFLFKRRKKNKHAKKSKLDVPPASVGSVEGGRKSLTPNKIPTESIVILKVIGRGHFGEVYKASWNGTEVALKTVHKLDKSEFLRECELLSNLNHPNILRFLGLWTSKQGELYIVTEFVSGGALNDYLVEHGAELNDADLFQIVLQIATAMQYLVQYHIVHRDLSARNVLIAKDDGKYQIKVSDFGLSRFLVENHYSSQQNEFPLKWSSPEVINHRTFSEASDVWSFGITCWEVYERGKIPYPNLTNGEAAEAATKGYRLPRPKSCPHEVYRVMLACWNNNPQMRPNFLSIQATLTDLVRQAKIVPSATEPEYSRSDLPSTEYSPIQSESKSVIYDEYPANH